MIEWYVLHILFSSVALQYYECSFRFWPQFYMLHILQFVDDSPEGGIHNSLSQYLLSKHAVCVWFQLGVRCALECVPCSYVLSSGFEGGGSPVESRHTIIALKFRHLCCQNCLTTCTKLTGDDSPATQMMNQDKDFKDWHKQNSWDRHSKRNSKKCWLSRHKDREVME